MMKKRKAPRIKGVIENAQKRFEERKKNGIWYQRAKPFREDLYLAGKKKAIVIKLFNILYEKDSFKKIDNKIIQLEVVIANLLSTRYPLVISLNTNEWKLSRYHELSSFVINIVHKLKEMGYIGLKIGFNDKTNPQKSRKSRIWAEQKLIDECPILPTNIVAKPKELIILKDWDGKRISYSDYDHNDIKPIRKQLENANRVNNAASIKYNDYNIKVNLTAIFKGSFDYHGRLYTKGYRHYRHLQGLKKKERKKLTINNEPVIELDFRGLHANLLYAQESQQFKGDPYLRGEEDKNVRKFFKQVLLCMLNADSLTKAEKAANYWLKKHPDVKRKLLRINITRARPIIDKFIEDHSTIAKYFFDGEKTGLKVMNKDSKIALDIVKFFIDKNIPILPVHDSFIVQERYGEQLKSVMKKVYKKHTGGFEIEVRINS